MIKWAVIDLEATAENARITWKTIGVSSCISQEVVDQLCKENGVLHIWALLETGREMYTATGYWKGHPNEVCPHNESPGKMSAADC